MRTRDEFIRACEFLPGIYTDMPFHDDNWLCLRHKGNDKVFAFVFERQGYTWVSVKALPEMAEFWKQAFSAVESAYHLNKRHWIGIRLDGTMDDGDILPLITQSYDLTAPKVCAKHKEEPL